MKKGGRGVLPEKFAERMKDMLGEDFDAFMNALGESAVRAVRINETKIPTEDFLAITRLSLSPLSYAEDGFIPDSADGIGRSPEHHAGMIYVQDPGAMATVNALDIQRGWRVLDTCAAPGGKASQLASRIGEEGFLLANEYLPKRTKITVGNLERLGVRNAIVTSLDTAELPRMFDGFFDLVLCDAPCSGEGMFRKYGEAITEWSEENVRLCAERQKEILSNSAPCVRAGGYLLYSTCTYSYEENEQTVAHFLESHPDFSLVPVREELSAVTAPGLCGMKLARRFYPHISKGEGQFIALMKKDENAGKKPTVLYKDAAKAPTGEEIAAVNEFFSENMTHAPRGRLIKQGEGVALLPEGTSLPPRSVFMAGVMLGEVKGRRLIPHHQLFSAYGGDFSQKERLTADDGRVEKYLRGEEIPARDCTQGWCAVTYEGVPLGGGKTSGGMIKNHYPKGLRNK